MFWIFYIYGKVLDTVSLSISLSQTLGTCILPSIMIIEFYTRISPARLTYCKWLKYWTTLKTIILFFIVSQEEASLEDWKSCLYLLHSIGTCVIFPSHSQNTSVSAFLVWVISIWMHDMEIFGFNRFEVSLWSHPPLTFLSRVVICGVLPCSDRYVES